MDEANHKERLKFADADPNSEQRQQAQLQGSAEWLEPIPLIREDDEPLPYPVAALGTIIGEAVREFQSYGKQPLAMVGSSALATASLACQGLANVARDSMNIGPISLSILCVAESGERKTSTDQAFSKPLRDWQRSQVDGMQDKIRKSTTKHSGWKSEREGLLNAIREAKKTSKPMEDKSLDSLKSELERQDLEEPEILRPPQLFFEDSTSEALAWFAANGHPTFALWSDEAGLTLGSQGMKEDRLMSFLALMNRLWDGGEFMPTRKTTETALVSGRRMTVNLMLQPAVLDQWQEARKGLSRGIGAFARFLILKPETTMGTRHYQLPPEASPKLFNFSTRVQKLMCTDLTLDKKGRLTLLALQFSPEAKQLWTQYHDKVESGLAPGGELSEVRDFASKSAEQAARIAGVLHVFENGPLGTITAETMKRVIKLAAWYLHEAGRVFTASALPPVFHDAVQLLNWIKSRCEESQESQLSQASVLRRGPNQLRDQKRRDAALKVLEDHQWVRLETVNREKLILVNPALIK